MWQHSDRTLFGIFDLFPRMIETLDEWNDRITSFGTMGCCDCEIPGQDGISFLNESLTGGISLYGFQDSGNLYTTRIITYSGGGTRTQTYTGDHGCTLGGVTIVAVPTINTVDSGTLTGTQTTSFSGLIDEAAALATGRAAVEAAVDWDTMDIEAGTIGGFENSLPHFWSIAFARLKFRKADFAVSNPPGNYIKFTFDVIDYPDAGVDVAFATDETLEWSGTFDLDDQENPANYTDFYYIDPPTAEGTREIKNMRFTRFQTATRYGNKPQTSGDFGTFP